MTAIKNILFARDFTPCAEHAARYAFDLAARTGAKLHVVHAEELNPDRFNPPEQPAGAAERLRARLKARIEGITSATFEPGSVPIEHAVVRGVAAAPAILRYAESHDIDVIVVGTHGRQGLRHFVLGSVAEEVTRRARGAVLAVPLRSATAEARPVTSILAATDFSADARHALRDAIALSTLYGASLEVLHVVETAFYPGLDGAVLGGAFVLEPGFAEQVRARMRAEYAAAGGEEGSATFTVVRGDPAIDILKHAAAHRPDLIVMGTLGQTGLGRVLVGSVAERVLRQAPCPVYVTRLPRAPGAGQEQIASETHPAVENNPDARGFA